MSNFRAQVNVPGGEFHVTRQGVAYEAYAWNEEWSLPLDRAEEVFRSLHATVEMLLALEPTPLPEPLFECSHVFKKSGMLLTDRDAFYWRQCAVCGYREYRDQNTPVKTT